MTNMSRVERRKAQNLYEDHNAALADDLFEEDEESLPTRQSVKNQREKKKKQGKTRTPLFTTLAVLFVFVPVIVFVALFYLMKSHPGNPDDYEDVFIDSSQSKYEVVQKPEAKKETQETVLREESKKKSEDKKTEKQTEATTDKKQPAVAEKEETANKQEAKSAAASPFPEKTVQKEQEQIPQQPEPVQETEAEHIVKHTVQKKETLYRISMRYYKSRSGEEKIRAYNHLNGNDVYTGQILDIPLTY
ncbi:LysM peptidoglycan-binding domain-containing protein [Bacillus mojavensis]|uniref:LysM peptidoglycan-binding domain-containing protein n=1 Tax=Bacillus mojavensis TaxID=72360 RepID=A0AAP3CQP5_BACMO|nr:LysM peptidoglycan-binding domain-containing protein [Bacillus mojavensis]MCY8104289.1 LysM peptidoglycan-binding domain-containing protein [Bacillus mojavensis]MCY8480463.1 LysM peptidoglycan-binding domain-containing protein [Bacillus mojavensis]MCY8509475.1 LysM peptidoglycan-binding domain-containing protein [Bacillus mojavensis]